MKKYIYVNILHFKILFLFNFIVHLSIIWQHENFPDLTVLPCLINPMPANRLLPVTGNRGGEGDET